jgi:hypothetical protein
MPSFSRLPRGSHIQPKDHVVGDGSEQIACRHLELHARAIRGERAAVERLADELWGPVCRRLRRAFPRAAIDLIVDATHDAIVAYTSRPLSFAADRRVPLDRFVFGVAARILRDRVRSEARRSRRERDYAAHMWQTQAERPDDRVTSRIAARELQRALTVVCSGTELSAMAAWLSGDDHDALARCLGLARLGRTERQQAVKRFMARVIKRLQRHFASRRSRPSLPDKFNG